MRIIAGSARGRQIEAPEGRNTRPTLDRVREAMFGMIQFDVENALVLDLFAGSGALGLEALSRGANKAVFCDSSKSAAMLVRCNLDRLGFSDRAEVMCMDCFSCLDALALRGMRFNIVLLDPPYAGGLYEKTLNALAEKPLLAPGCIILAEHPLKQPVGEVNACYKRSKTHRYGDVAVTRFDHECAPEEAFSAFSEAPANAEEQ